MPNGQRQQCVVVAWVPRQRGHVSNDSADDFPAEGEPELWWSALTLMSGNALTSAGADSPTRFRAGVSLVVPSVVTSPAVTSARERGDEPSSITPTQPAAPASAGAHASQASSGRT